MIMVRRFFSLACVMTMLVSMFALAGGTAQAQQDATAAPGLWATNIGLQNIGTTPASAVTIDFYSGNDGTVAQSYALPTDVLTPLQDTNGYTEVYVPARVSDLGSGQYSAVVSSDVELQAIVNTGSTDTDPDRWTLFAYEGFGSADTGQELFFPGLYKAFFGFESEMVIQNAGDSATTPTVTIYSSVDGTALVTDLSLGSIEPNESQTYPLQDALFSALPTGTNFGAIVSADQPLAGVANIWRPDAASAGTASYSAFTSGSNTLYAPSLYQNYFGFGSALTVQNIGGDGTAADVEVRYSDGTTVSATIDQYASLEFPQGNANTLPEVDDLPIGNTDGLFNAEIVSTNNVPIVALVSVSQSWDYAPPGVNYFASYSVPQEAASTLNIPIVMQNYYGYFSAVTVQNTSGTDADVTLTYATGQTWTQNIPAGETRNFAHRAVTDGPLPESGNGGAPGTATAAVVTSDPAVSLVAVVQQNTANDLTRYDPTKASGDYLSAFTGTAEN
jgi:hypothetical protein